MKDFNAKLYNMKDLEKWVWNTLDNDLPERYTYHCKNHISDVLRDALKIAKHYKISDKDRMLLQVAALFHDIGFVKSHLDHEKNSAEIAAAQLPQYGFNGEDISIIGNMILATKIPQSPNTFLEQILCDADLFYLGEMVYPAISERLKMEWENIGIFENEDQWLEVQIKFLENHNFHTDFAREELDPIKQVTLARLRSTRQQ